jgi:nitroreductase
VSFLELAKKRCSVRRFLPKEVEDEKLMQVLEAARVAPSACNLQPWHIIVAKNPKVRQQLYESYPRDWFAEVPVVLVVCVDRAQSWKRADGKDYGDVDIAIAVDHMTLAAADLGLGTCWLGAFDVEKCSRALQLPRNLEPLVMLPLGYPKQTESPERHKTRRKSLEEFVRWE